MPIIRTLLAFTFAVAAVAGCSSSAAERKPQKEALVKSVEIPVQGMACDSCAERIAKKLAGMDGVLDANVSFDDKRAVIRYDARQLEPSQLASAISGLGFEAGTPVERKP